MLEIQLVEKKNRFIENNDYGKLYTVTFLIWSRLNFIDSNFCF
jgi:hypothetical protein